MTPINELRQKKGLTIKQFAEVLGISESLLQKLLYGARKPSVNVIKRISEVYPKENLKRFF